MRGVRCWRSATRAGEPLVYCCGVTVQTSEPGGKTYVLTYHYVADMVERRGLYRDAHRARLRQAHADHFLLVGGSYDNPADAAVLVVRAQSAADVYAWAARDPYHEGGLITAVTVREFNLAFAAPA